MTFNLPNSIHEPLDSGLTLRQMAYTQLIACGYDPYHASKDAEVFAEAILRKWSHNRWMTAIVAVQATKCPTPPDQRAAAIRTNRAALRARCARRGRRMPTRRELLWRIIETKGARNFAQYAVFLDLAGRKSNCLESVMTAADEHQRAVLHLGISSGHIAKPVIRAEQNTRL